MQWQTLFKKEMVGYWRDRKWIWIPLVFILLTIMDPITNYYLPQILEAVGGLPDGAVFQLPDISAPDAFMMSFSQLSSIGVLVIAFASMGIIAGERKSGIAELILVKPISFQSYITSKWAALLVLIWLSYLLSMLAAWYYIGVLYEFISFVDFILMTFFYGLWLSLVTSVSVFFNALSRTPGLVGFLTIATMLLLSFLTMLFGERFIWSPNHISSYIHTRLLTGEIPSDLYFAASLTAVLSIGFIILAIFIFRKKEHAS